MTWVFTALVEYDELLQNVHLDLCSTDGSQILLLIASSRQIWLG